MMWTDTSGLIGYLYWRYCSLRGLVSIALREAEKFALIYCAEPLGMGSDSSCQVDVCSLVAKMEVR